MSSLVEVNGERTPNRPARLSHRIVLARSIALFFGAFSALGLLDTLRGFDPNVWWIDLRFLPGPLARAPAVPALCCCWATPATCPAQLAASRHRFGLCRAGRDRPLHGIVSTRSGAGLIRPAWRCRSRL